VDTAPPLALTGFLPAWDIARRAADLEGLAAWALREIRRRGHPIADLATAHTHLDGDEARATAKALTATSLDPEARGHLHRAVRALVPEIPADRVWIQTRAHFRILVPGDGLAPFPPHTDYGFGHDLAERNLWLSLTDAEESAALHVLALRPSMEWMGRAAEIHGILHGAPEIPPVPTRRGEALLFTPLHLHRARTPPPGRTRVSVDVRLVPRMAERRDLSFSVLERAP
jgi:hypothetical protein